MFPAPTICPACGGVDTLREEDRVTPNEVLRRAAQHWYERLIDGDASADWDGFDRDLEAALKEPTQYGPMPQTGGGADFSLVTFDLKPRCVLHGAMNKVSPVFWRCIATAGSQHNNCRAGCMEQQP